MLENLPVINQIKEAINKANRVLLISHQKPDGDALGVLSAMAGFLKSIKKDYAVFCLDEVPPEYQFIPLTNEFKNDVEIFTHLRSRDSVKQEEKFDVVIVMDSGDLKYAGVADFVGKNKGYTLINIDHHYTNDFFGDLNLVLADRSSVSEIIFELFKLWQVKIDKEISTALLNGLIFDTGALSNPATSKEALKISASLLNSGARFGEIKSNLLNNKSLNLLKIWGVAFERISYNEKYQMAFTVLTADDLAKAELNAESSLGLINFFNELAGVKSAMLLVEQPDGFIKGSLRTTNDNVDVSALAKAFGGGGHQKAAGFTIKGKLVYNKDKWQIE